MTDGHPEEVRSLRPLQSVSYDDDETLLAQSVPVPLPRRPQDDLAPGMMLGEYKLEREIGQGGMSVVFAAVHPLIGKRAAIKVLTPELCRDPRSVSRFIDEARVVNQIGHPNIVDVFAFGVLPDGRHYLVMELLQGETLGARMARQRLTLAETCAVLKPLARALEVVHDKGITHRDLKPDNVFLVAMRGDQPVIKLLDFGIAKLSWQEYGVARTAVGVMMGTPMYMAPEQAKGYEVDTRADIYAFGGIMFEMLTGRPVFLADNAPEVIAKHMMEDAPRLSQLARVPADIDDLVAAMLSKEPNDRPTLDRIHQVLERNLAQPPRVIAAPQLADTAIAPAVTPQVSAVAVAPPRSPRASRRVAQSIAIALAVAVISFIAVRSVAPTVAREIAATPNVDATSVAPSVNPRPAAGDTPPAVPAVPAVIDQAAQPGSVPDPRPADHQDPDPPVPTRLQAPPPSTADPATQPVEVKRRSPRTGHLALAIVGASNYFVIVDGKPQGMRSELALPAGAHEIEVQAAGVTPQRFSVQIKAGKTTQRDVRWTPAAEPTKPGPADGELLPPGATVPRRPR